MIRSVMDMPVRGRTLVVRADLNVPLAEGRVTDATRIERFAAGMRPLLMSGARLVVLTHLGRPKGKPVDGLSTEVLRADLAKAMGATVEFCPASSGRFAEGMVQAMLPGEVLLCENLRFDPREEANDPELGRELARLGDLYVNDAFSCAHRAHASTEAITHVLPSAAGPLMMEELGALGAALDSPKRPCVAIVGGAKVSTKIDVLLNLVGKVDAVIVGGGMANTFLAAKGAPMGLSLHEADQLDTAREIMLRARQAQCDILLPQDVVCATRFEADAPHETVMADQCPETAMILDAGADSVALFKTALDRAATVLWNGPLGAFELSPFDAATVALARHAAELTRAGGLTSVAGGGDTVAALNAAGATEDFTYVSTAGGAFLEWLEGKTLPGIAALEAAQRAA